MKKLIIIIMLLFNIIILFQLNLSAVSTDNQNWRSFMSDKHYWGLGAVNGLAVTGNRLFVSGYFSQRSYDSVWFNCIAELQDSIWLPLGSGEYAGIRGNMHYEIIDILIKDSSLYVVGSFDTAGTIRANNIAKWNINSRTWSSVGLGTNGSIGSIVEMNNKIYIGGMFDSLYTSNDTVIAHNIAIWDGTNWDNLGNGLNAPPYDMFVSGNNLFVVGEFDSVGSMYSKHIGIWNDSTNQWTGFGNYGPEGEVFAVCKVDGSVYFGGYFDSVNTSNGNVTAKNITRWDGTSWFALDDGIDGDIQKLKTDGTNLYIAGSFEKEKSDSDICENIVMWDGSDWQFFGSGSNLDIIDITFWGDSLLVGGSFSITGDTLAIFIGLWYAGEIPGKIEIPTNIGNVNNISIIAYPNPAKEEVEIEFYIESHGGVEIIAFDVAGNAIDNVLKGNFKKGWHKAKWSVSRFDSGIYFINLNINGKSTSTKLIISR